MKVLLVEDEPKVVDFLRQGLHEQGYEIDVAYDGKMGERLANQNKYDLIILDVIIPHINGYELCKLIREKDPHVPVLMLTALGAMDDKLAGFDSGADDYLVKPFEFKELMARIKALTKRSFGAAELKNTLKVSDLVLDLNKKSAIRGSKAVDLTAKEFALLEFLMRNKDRKSVV